MRFRPYVSDDFSTYMELDISDLDINNKEALIPFTRFSIKAYNKLNSVKNTENLSNKEWDYVFGYVSAFFDSLSNSDKKLIAETFININIVIDKYQKERNVFNTNSMIKDISMRLGVLDKAINLCAKLKDYVYAYIPVGIMKDAGTRPQDRPETTFTAPEVMLVATITLLCKMLCPIYSAIMLATDKVMNNGAKEVSNRTLAGVKEAQCSCILTDIINQHAEVNPADGLPLKEVTEKLKNYLEHTTRQSHREDKDSNIVYGYDVHTLSYNLYCTLLVRRLVTVNLARTDSNLMSYIVVCARRSVTGVMGQVASNAPTMPRTPIAAESDDDGNIARLETDSLTSRKTADVEALITVAVKPTIEKVMYLNDISEEEFNSCLQYYQSHPLSPNTINTQLNSLLYGRDFDGSVGIKMLKFPEFSQITVLTQMILLQRASDPAYRELAHLVTARPRVGATTAALELNGNNVWVQVASSSEFKACVAKFQNSTITSKSKIWENHIHKIIADITDNHYEYNTAPYIWEWLGEENRNGKLIPLNQNILIAYCHFYNWELESRDMARKVTA